MASAMLEAPPARTWAPAPPSEGRAQRPRVVRSRLPVRLSRDLLALAVFNAAVWGAVNALIPV